MTYEKVSVDLIDPSPYQVRPVETDDVLPSVERLGLLQPVLPIRPKPNSPGRYQLVFGHRRLHSLRANGVTEVLCEVKALSDREMAESLLAENEDRRQMSDFERGLVFKKYHDEFGASVRDIQTLAGLDYADVSRCMAIVTMGEKVAGPAAAVKPEEYEHAVTTHKFEEAVSLKKEGMVVKALSLITEHDLNTAETKVLVHEIRQGSDPEKAVQGVLLNREDTKARRYRLKKNGLTKLICTTCGRPLFVKHGADGSHELTVLRREGQDHGR